MLRFFFFSLLGVGSVLSTSAFAQERDWTANFFFENDLFANTDLNYTNGMRLTVVSPDLLSFDDKETETYRIYDWMRDFMEDLPLHPAKIPGLDPSFNFSASVGQIIYTPADRTRTTVDPDDRPYAGWLYVGVGLQSRVDKSLYSLEMNIGMVGPLSLAEQTQNFIHDIRNIDRFQGWDNQLKSEPGLLIAFERKYRMFDYPLAGLHNVRTDFITHWGGAIGNVATYGNVGAEWRIGLNLPNDFGTSTLKPGGDNSTPGINEMRDVRWRVQGFIATDARMVVQNIFLDGNTFRDSHSVEKEPGVADVAMGFAVNYYGIKLSYAYVYRTREFETQSQAQKYGSVSLSFKTPIKF